MEPNFIRNFVICRISRLVGVIGGLILLMAGCGAEAPLPTMQPVAEMPAVPPTPALATAVSTSPPAPTPTPAPLTLTADANVPPELLAAAQQLPVQFPAQFRWVTDPQTADLRLTLQSGAPLATWWLAVVAPFPTVADGVTMAAVQQAWRGEGASLRVAADAAAMLTALWGDGAGAALTPAAELVDQLWAERPSLGVVPFHRLQPRLKVMQLDEQSPLDPLLPDTYPLAVTVGVMGEETAVAALLAAWTGPVTNRDTTRLTRVALTGVTALTRATAYQMELRGVDAPGTAVGPILAAADIAHVSNEVSFAPDCPYPDPVGGTVFCSRDSYFALLEQLGVDVVELTGNHVNDWGTDSLLHSLDLYAQAGMETFGGGRDLAAAAEPARFTHNGNQIAFVGCNPVGPAYAWAGENSPGSRPCDGALAAQIAQLREEGYLVIATQQYHEFYHYAPTAQQEADFAALAAAGATAVSGSQGHHAQGVAFAGDAFVHYGLGNLFFDQMDMLGTRQTFVDTLVLYDGRLISVVLWTGLIENYCCPREMSAAERAQALTAVFQASGW